MTSQDESQSPFLVVIGASAGGLESLSAVIGDLPEDFGAPVVIGMHVSPSRVSSLGEILDGRSRLPVNTLEEHVRLLPGHIYVVPANRNVQITDGHALLTIDNDGPQPSVDLLFRTAAEAYGENLLAVVLSGTGSDGAIGARYVKMSGGTVIVQNPDTAAYPGMPLSLSLSDVDLTASLDRIGGLLTEFIDGGLAVPPVSETSMLRSFLEELREESGVDFTTYRQATIQRRVQRRMVATGNRSFPDYLRMVRRNPRERQQLVKSFLINVTRFYRDEELFDYMREHVLPELIREAGRRNDELRIWSAGCSTGEEAYSLAIVVFELLQEAGVEVNARIFATDLDEEAVAFARQGVYPARAVRELPEDIIERYFTPIGDEFEVKKHIRSMLIFGEHDLARRAPFPRIDLILCRNVLIYFTMPLQRRALELFAFSLRNGGYLVLGKSETISPLGEHFAPDQTALKVFRRIGSRTQMLRSHIADFLPLPHTRAPMLRDSQLIARTRAARSPQHSEIPSRARDDEGILYWLPCGVVVVNRSYDIEYINTEARRLFGIHTTAIDQDLIHLVQHFDPMSVRRLIDAAAHSGQPTRDILFTSDPGGEAVQSIEASCRVMVDGDDTSIVVAVFDVTERERFRRRLAAAEETATRLMKANEEVLADNHELTRTIQILREENEEMQVATAEIQAATEEVETLNEELQASNEELETLNEELQATIEELNTTNDDLEARSLELQSMALTAENARHQVHSILDAVGDGIVVVNERESIVLQSQSITHLVGDGKKAPEFLDESGNVLDGERSPLARVARGDRFTIPLWIRDQNGDVQTYEADGRPTAGANGSRLGVLSLRLIPESEETTSS